MTEGPAPRIAVCLAAYNGIRYLRQQLDSIFTQDGVNVTLFASIDISSDGTEQWFEAFAAEQPQCVVLSHGQRFGGAAQNFFRLLRDVDFEQFDHVAFSDQDDIWMPDKLMRAVRCLTENQAQGYSSDVIAFWESSPSRYIRKSYPQRQWDFLFESAGPGCTYVLRQSLARDIQDFLRLHQDCTSDIGLHDWFCYAFARARSLTWYIDNQARMLYRQHDGNQVGANAGWRAFVWRAQQVLNGWGLNQARSIARLVMPPHDPFVARWVGGGRRAVWNLLWRAGQCRRKPLDRFWFAASCAALCVLGWA